MIFKSLKMRLIKMLKEKKYFLKILIILFAFSYSMHKQKSYAQINQNIEVWFLSYDDSAAIKKKMLYELEVKFSQKLYSEVEGISDFGCIPMGDGCFNPQTGLIPTKKIISTPKKDKKKLLENKQDQIKYEKVDDGQDKNSLPSFGAVQRNMIVCDKKNAFDLFCGEAHDVSAPKTDTEIWIDISSSMKESDPAQDKDGRDCYRKWIVRRFKQSCGDKFEVYLFNTHLKKMDTEDSACINYGLNDTRSLTQWISKSKAKNILIITDKNEISIGFTEFLNSEGAKIQGGESNFSAKLALQNSERFAKVCSKKGL